MTATSESALPGRGLNLFARLTAGATFLLLIAGGLVTSNDAGLAVPDWPLSYGSLMPPMVGNIVYEHGHRMIATFVGMLTIVLVLWLRLREPRRWVRRVGYAALATVVAQGILGGLTVLFLLPRPVSIAHACLAQTFFCLLVSLAVFTGPAWLKDEPKSRDAGGSSLFQLAILTTAAVFGQLLLGAAYRHNALGILPHVAGAVLVAVLVVKTARAVRQTSSHPALQRPARLLTVLLFVQLVLGGGAYASKILTASAAQPQLSMVVLTVVHLAVGALLLATSVVLTLHAHRLLDQSNPVAAMNATGEEATA